MLTWILAALAVFVLQTLLPASIQYLMGEGEIAANLGIALRGRDDPPPMPVVGGRAQRALANMQEALPVFLTLAVLAVVLDAEDPAGAGAIVFVVARALYVPAYLSAVPGLRSAIWMGSWVGLILLGYAVIDAAGTGG